MSEPLRAATELRDAVAAYLRGRFPQNLPGALATPLATEATVAALTGLLKHLRSTPPAPGPDLPLDRDYLPGRDLTQLIEDLDILAAEENP